MSTRHINAPEMLKLAARKGFQEAIEEAGDNLVASAKSPGAWIGAASIPAAFGIGHLAGNMGTNDPVTRSTLVKMMRAMEVPESTQIALPNSPTARGFEHAALAESGLRPGAPRVPTAFIGPRSANAVVAHELGHLSGRSPISVFDESISAALPGRQATVARGRLPGIVAAALSNHYSRKVAPAIFGASLLLDPESTVAKAAPYAAFGVGLPVLWEEGRATMRAMKGLKAIGRSRLKGLARLLPGFASYAAIPVGSAVGSELARRHRAENM